jgi:hypothetical protein
MEIPHFTKVKILPLVLPLVNIQNSVNFYK